MNRKLRHKRVRAKIKGTAERPRICVFRSLKKITAQAIDDSKGHTLARSENIEAGKSGEDLARVLLSKKIKAVVFDRSGYKYHGKVKALAEAIRQAGLKF